MTGRTCGNCGVAIANHHICLRCAEEWQARPYVHFRIEHFGEDVWAIQGVDASGETSPDLMNLSVNETDHPMLAPTEAETDAIVRRISAFLELTTAELKVVLEATARAAPELGTKLRNVLTRSL